MCTLLLFRNLMTMFIITFIIMALQLGIIYFLIEI